MIVTAGGLRLARAIGKGPVAFQLRAFLTYTLHPVPEAATQNPKLIQSFLLT